MELQNGCSFQFIATNQNETIPEITETDQYNLIIHQRLHNEHRTNNDGSRSTY
jgi:hypothetical protein